MDPASHHDPQNDEETNEIESKFLELSKWATFSNKILGQFPFTRLKSRKRGSSFLHFNLFSFPIIYSIFLMLIFISWLLYYYLSLRKKVRFLQLFGPTETLAYNFMVLGTSIGRLHIQIRSLLRARKTLEFFRKNCSLLLQFQKFGYNLEGKWTQKLSSRMKVFFIGTTIFVILQISYVHLYTALHQYFKFTKKGKDFWPRPAPDTEERIGAGLFWTSVTYLNTANLWLVFCIQLYTELFQQIIAAEEDSSNAFVFKVSSYHFPKIFVKELLYNKATKPSHQVQPIHILQNFFATSKSNRSDLNLKWRSNLHKSQAEISLNLYVGVRQLAKEFNEMYSVEIIWDLFGVANTTIYFFFGCFWLQKGLVRVVADLILPLVFYPGKIILLGIVCARLGKSSKLVVPAIMKNIRMEKIGRGTRRRV
ncbi:unnamed protein product [Orchesella dallaii]|uniref:Gustatory receptor n=1 Tax=Orchesella dallaii TaxID=48710 RepID=A0ABP1Q0M5_9HEXA